MILPVTPHDFPAIQKLIETEFPYLKRPRQQLESKIKNPFFFLFKTMHEKKLAGFCEIEVLEEGKTVRLNGLAVLSEYRKKGFGNRLLSETIEFLAKHGFETVWLLVKRENKIARALYEKQGFVHVRELPQKIDHAVAEEYRLELQPIA